MDYLAKITRWLIIVITKKIKDFWLFCGLTALFVFVIMIIDKIILNLTLMDKSILFISKMGSLFVAIVGASYAIIQYRNHLQEEKRKVLCEYNQRYSTDKNIDSVIRWMLKVAETNKIDGDIIGVKTNTNVKSPGIHKKEMFMRFFEELNLRLDKGDLTPKDVYDLFSYYALKYDRFRGFRLDIKDYRNDLEIKFMNENDRKEFKDNWAAYHSFIQKMKEEEYKQFYKGTKNR